MEEEPLSDDSDDGDGAGITGFSRPSSDVKSAEAEAGSTIRDYYEELDDQLGEILDGGEAEGATNLTESKDGLQMNSRHVRVHAQEPISLDVHAMEHVLASYCQESNLEMGPASLLLGELG